ncbi:PolC-type DNA polymerase III [Paenisporosarcina sp. TG20]|uniref:3'-5' exonuclease n=1 Tax=Paenisporosarcina sp. TG20 TaxID=1211706 RepID=UPI0003108D8C|nr:3'-5' exonuclease [Paenisporosarcina sp. TG20]
MALWSKKEFQNRLNSELPLSTPLNDMSFLVVDTETTGFSVGKDDRLIEVGAVPIVGLNVLENKIFQSYVNPKRDIPEIITDLTSISNEDVKHAPDSLQVIEDLFEFAKQLGANSIAGHYITFDMLVFKHELRRADIKFQMPPSIDTLDLLSYLVPNWELKDLEYYAAVFETRIFERHTAVGDALTTAYLFCELCERIKERGKYTWGDLLALSPIR